MKLSHIANGVTTFLRDFGAPKNTSVAVGQPLANPGSLSTPLAAQLYDEQATDLLVQMLTKMPDLEDTLRQAGIQRYKLRVLLTDDEISQVCETRRDALLATPVHLEPGDTEQSKRLMELLQPHMAGLVATVFKARLFGYSVIEAVYAQTDKGDIGFAFLGEKPMQWFEPKSDGKLIFYPNDGRSSGYGLEVDQEYKFFCTRNMPTYEMPYGEAILAKLYWPWFFRTNGWKFWGKFLERFGTPLLVGNSSDPTAMVKALLMAHSNAVVGIGPDDKVAAVGAAQGAGTVFADFEAASLRRIQKVVLGQTLTSGTDGGSGNRALGQVHELVRMDKRNADIMMATATLQRVVDALCKVNSWAPVKVWFADDQGLESDRAERDSKLYTQGVRFTPDYYQDNYDLRATDFEMASEAAPEGETPPALPGAPAKGAKVGQPPAKSGAKKDSAVKASQLPGHLFSQLPGGRKKFTKQQQQVEDQADAGLEEAGLPLDLDAIRTAITAATSPEDLEDRLFALIGDQVAQEDFVEVLERALFAADVLGYVHAEGKV